MLIFPPGHAQTAIARPRLRQRERWMITGVLGTILALLVVVVISLTTAGHSSIKGCVDVTVPYSIGGQEFYRCGAGARALCGLVGAPGGFSAGAGRSVATACRKAGVPVGPAS